MLTIRIVDTLFFFCKLLFVVYQVRWRWGCTIRLHFSLSRVTSTAAQSDIHVPLTCSFMLSIMIHFMSCQFPRCFTSCEFNYKFSRRLFCIIVRHSLGVLWFSDRMIAVRMTKWWIINNASTRRLTYLAEFIVLSVGAAPAEICICICVCADVLSENVRRYPTYLDNHRPQETGLSVFHGLCGSTSCCKSQ